MRSLFLALVILAIAIGLVSVSILAVLISKEFGDPTQSLVAVGDVAAFGTLYFAVVASVVALVAYQVASRRPDLTVSIKFPFSEINRPVLPHVEPATTGSQLVALDETVDLKAELWLSNKTNFSARNPYVRLELVNLAGLAVPKDWNLLKTGAGGVTQIEWDGGDRSVHDRRDLPVVTFAGVKMLRGASEYRLDIHVAAEGFARKFPIRVELLPREAWNQKVG